MTDSLMLAAVYHGPEDLRVEYVPRPRIGRNEVLLKVAAANICGTDIRILRGGHRQYPAGTVRIPGHEVVGAIVELGDEVQGYAIGQQVFVAPNMGHASDRNTLAGHNNRDPHFEAIGIHLDGAFAEYLRIPARAINQGNLMPVPTNIPSAVAALVEPLACVLRGQNAIDVHAGDVVLVMGAGPIGLLHLLLAKLRGASRVIVSQTSQPRRELAAQLGADQVVDPVRDDLAAVVEQASDGRGADVVIVAAPSKNAQESALSLAAIGGRINFFGGLSKQDPYVHLDANLIHYHELVVTGTTACSTYDCWQALDIVKAGRIDLSPLITGRFSLRDANAAFQAAGDGTNLRVTLEPPA